MRLPTDEVLARLKDFSTASVSNVVGTYPEHPSVCGFMTDRKALLLTANLNWKAALVRKEVKSSIQNDLTNEPIILIFKPIKL